MDATFWGLLAVGGLLVGCAVGVWFCLWKEARL